MSHFLRVLGSVCLLVVAATGGYMIARILGTDDKAVEGVKDILWKNKTQVKKTGGKIPVIDNHCRLASTEICSTLSETLFSRPATKLKELLSKQNSSECADVKTAVRNCEENYKYDYAECMYKFCEFTQHLENTKLVFWLQDNFTVTEQNIEQVKANPKRKRYICIQKNETSAISVGAFCIKKNLFSSFSKKLSDKPIHASILYEFLPKNCEEPTILDKEIAKKINVYQLNDLEISKEIFRVHDMSVYTYYGKIVERDINEDVFILPSSLKVTPELLHWMSGSSNVSDALCNALGLRKLEEVEVEAVSNHKSDLECFYKLKDQNDEFEVWAFGKGIATSKNYAHIPKKAMELATTTRDVLFSHDDIDLPEWGRFKEKIYFKKMGSRVLDISPEDFNYILKYELLSKQLKEKDAFFIIDCFDVKLPEKIYFLKHLNKCLFYNQKLNVAEYMLQMKNIRDGILKSYIGQVFYVKFAQIPGKNWTSLPYISMNECENLIINRTDFHNIKCEEFKIQSLIISKHELETENNSKNDEETDPKKSKVFNYFTSTSNLETENNYDRGYAVRECTEKCLIQIHNDCLRSYTIECENKTENSLDDCRKGCINRLGFS